MKVGKLIHTITFYTIEYIDNGNGTKSEKLKELRKVKCSIDDITYKYIESAKKNDIAKTLKVHTHYFKEFETKDIKAKINKEDGSYEIINRENVSYRNTELIFIIKKILDK